MSKITVAALFLSMLLAACSGLPRGSTEFERFSRSFSREASRAEQTIADYSALVSELSGYEKRVGNLSNVDYDTIEKLSSNIADSKKKMDLQIQKAKDTGRSVTAEGYYADTPKQVRGWDSAAYANMYVETELGALDQADREAGKAYGSLDFNLLARPNKPFNPEVTRLITQANIELASAKSDIAARDWASGRNAVDRANSAIKSALALELNDVEQYQMASIQNDLKKVSSDISLGSTLNKAGSIVEDAARGATGILGGIGEILKGVGEQLQK
jgi:hypothetical protein